MFAAVSLSAEGPFVPLYSHETRALRLGDVHILTEPATDGAVRGVKLRPPVAVTNATAFPLE
eukprot:7478563-Pyramimonas_sp.AAC.1